VLGGPAASTTPALPPPPALRDGYIAIGMVLTSFGLDGAIKVEPLTDFPERFEPGRELWLARRKRKVQHSRWQGQFVFLKLSGIATREAIAPLRGFLLEVPESQRTELPPGEFYRSDIEGMAVFTAAGEDLGIVEELMPTGANDVLVVRGARGEVLVPMVEDVILDVDVAGRRITIEPLEGLVPESAPVPKAPRVPPNGKYWRRAPRGKAARPPARG
jgi:16S rRNA processing protein RimM